LDKREIITTQVSANFFSTILRIGIGEVAVLLKTIIRTLTIDLSISVRVFSC
jgi:hypothetical protein